MKAAAGVAGWCRRVALIVTCLSAPVACGKQGPDLAVGAEVAASTSHDNDAFPVPRTQAVVPAPFPALRRAPVALFECETRHGEAQRFGTIDVPLGWRTETSPRSQAMSCESSRSMRTSARACEAAACELWSATSELGDARMSLSSPMRDASGWKVPEGKGSATARIADAWLRHRIGAMAGIEVLAASGPSDARLPATRRGWTSGGAWLAFVRKGALETTRELVAVEIESRDAGGGHHDIQTGPLLWLQVPAAQFDLQAATSIWASLGVDPQWIPQWWHAWELRTVRAHCEGGFSNGDCRRQPHAGISYFQSGRSLGVWDLRSDHPFAEPSVDGTAP